MKNILISLGIVAMMTSGSAFAADNTGAKEATVTINGKVTARTCNFTTESANKVVDLDPIDYTELQSNPKFGKNRKAFQLVLENCPIMTSDRERDAILFFDPQQASDVTPSLDALVNKAPQKKAAENVAVQLWNTTGISGNGKPIFFRDGMNRISQPLAKRDKNNQLTYDLVASYTPTKLHSVTPGEVQVRVPVKIEYK